MTFRLGARASACAIASVLFAAGCVGGDSTGSKTDLGTADDGTGAATSALVVTNLASDEAGVAANVGPSLGNAWGIVAFDGLFWIANEETGLISIFDGSGKPATGKVSSGTIDLGEGITGIAVNDMAKDNKVFPMKKGETCMSAQLIVASVRGQLIGINTDLSTTEGFVLVDRSDVRAVYLGVAIVHTSNGPLVLAADFFNGRIDVFDANFSLVTNISFVAPELPERFAPFNVMVFDDKVFVAYAQQSEDKTHEVFGPGLGFIAIFDSTGEHLGTIKSELFNAPWGMAMSGAHGCNVGAFPDALLVGNFGDGRITAVDLTDMTALGQLMLNDSTPISPISIEGLWGITFGEGVQKARPDGLYFAAGPDDEEHGLFGVIAPPER